MFRYFGLWIVPHEPDEKRKSEVRVVAIRWWRLWQTKTLIINQPIAKKNDDVDVLVLGACKYRSYEKAPNPFPQPFSTEKPYGPGTFLFTNQENVGSFTRDLI